MSLQFRTVLCCLLILLGASPTLKAIDDTVTVFPQINLINGSNPVFTVDSVGNRFVAGKFNGTYDFNPGVGIDAKTSSSDSLYVTRLNADGTYGWTQTLHVQTFLSANIVRSLVVADGKVFVVGTYVGVVRIAAGSPTPSAAGQENIFVAALDLNTGAPVLTFGRDIGAGVRNGIQTLAGPAGGGASIARYAAVADASGLYLVGSGSPSVIVGSAERTLTYAGTFIAKLSLTTGSLVAGFDGGILGFSNSGGTCAALSGNTLFVGGTISTNPVLTNGTATTSFTQAATGTTGFVLALDATSGAPKTAFDSDGLQVLPNASPTGLAASGATPFVTGGYDDTTLGIGATGSVPVYGGQDLFVAKLTAAGAPDLAFSADGLVVAGSAGLDLPRNIVVANGVVYAAVNIPADLTLDGGGTAVCLGTDLCILALDAASGSARTSFSGDGLFPFGGINADQEPSVAVSGSTVYLLGDTMGFAGASPGSAFILPIPAATGAVDYVVNSTLNSDATHETLQTAMAKARFGSTIRFDSAIFDLTNSFAATVITVGSPLPPMRDGGVTVDASNVRVTINGSTSTSNDSGNGFTLGSGGNTLKGFSLVGFPGIGIAIQGAGANRARSNVLGGNRLTGSGPNGEGLRIANCGSFGVRITGSDANVVKGTWLGLDVSGDTALPNVAGILIDGGSRDNTIGSTIAGEQNVISGNTFEGITVSGAGSDGTNVFGNKIGVAGVDAVESRSVAARAEEGVINGRANAANGASGIFLSKGTQTNTVGGTNAGEDNTVGFNGGSGIEVRAVASRKNASRSNRITRNKNGGIRLFDGSNNNIAPPSFDGVDRLPTRFARAVGASVRVRGSSAAAAGSVIEVFRDRGDQGEQIVGRANVAAGKWQVEADLLPDDNVTATVTDPDGNTSAFALFGRVPEASSGTPVITGTLAIQATVGVAVNYRIMATGTPTDYDALNLPAGLSINHSTGVISGSPTVTGAFSIDLAASNAVGTGAATLALTIAALPTGSPLIANPLSATGLVGAPFLYAIGLSADAGAVSYGASNLPTGLSIDAATGIISGTPTSAGVFSVPLSAANTFGQSVTAATFTILSGANSTTDSDGDGVSDALELLAQTDPLDSASKPAVQTTLKISKTSLGLSFISTKDKLKTTLTATPPAGTLKSAGILIGGLLQDVGLDAKGKGTRGGVTVSVKLKGNLATLTVSVANIDLEPALTDLGFGNRTTSGKNETLQLPVALRLTADTDALYQNQAPLLYKATAGKSGKATQAK